MGKIERRDIDEAKGRIADLRRRQAAAPIYPDLSDEIRYEQAKLRRLAHASAQGPAFIGFFGGVFAAYLTLSLVFRNADAGDFEWLVYLAGLAVVIGVGLAVAKALERRAEDRLLADLKPWLSQHASLR